MPIVWKIAFEEPLIKQIQSGAIGNSNQLARAIALQYDLAIKQGLSSPPGTPSGPFITGKPMVLEKAIKIFFKTTAIKQKIAITLIYIKYIKSIFVEMKRIYTTIKTTKNQIKKLQTEQKKLERQIRTKSSQRRITVEQVREIARLQKQLVFVIAAQLILIATVLGKTEELEKLVKPKIKELRDKLKKQTRKMLLPQTQDTKAKETKKLPKKIKELTSEFKEKKKKIKEDIKKAKEDISVAIKTFKALKNTLRPEHLIMIRTAINTSIQSFSLDPIAAAAASISSIIDSYPDEIVSRDSKNECKKALGKVFEAKLYIQGKKEELKKEITAKLNERKDELIKSFKPKTKPGPSKLEETKKDRKNIQEKIKEIRSTVKEARKTIKLVKLVRRETDKINQAVINKTPVYTPNSELVISLNEQRPGWGDTYAKLKTPTDAKSAIIVYAYEILSKNKTVTENVSKVKKELKEFKNQLLKKKFNREEKKFNSLLKLGITGYWTGGVWGIGTINNITFPGTVAYPVQMKTTANPANFIKSLSKAFQLHSKTVSGTITIPTPTGPIILPWLGYN